MNADRASQSEAATIKLLNQSVDAQLDELCLRLEVPTDGIPRQSPRATRIKEIWDRAKRKGAATLATLEEILCEQQGKREPSYWLYVSCAEADREDRLCQIFFHDLTSRLGARLHQPDGDMRYLDEGNPEDSEIWLPWSLRAMQRCRLMVCLYSKAFFSSPYCGRVWASFLRRLNTHQEAHGGGKLPSLIFPIFWKSPAENPPILPRVARELDFTQEDLGWQYCEDGLRFLVQQARAKRADYEAIYDQFLEKLAARLVQAADTWPLTDDLSIAPLKDIPSVFYQAPEDRRGDQEKGLEYAKFVYVAARRSEIEALRVAEAYDDEPEYWRPYHPLCREKLGIMSYLAASQAGIMPFTVSLDNNFLANIRLADDNGNIILMLIDPWTVQLEAYSQYVIQYDEADLLNSTVLVCWNEEDSETKKLRSKLLANLEMSLKRKVRAYSLGRFRNSIGSVVQLRQELTDALLWARRQIVDETQNPRVAQGLPFVRPKDLGISPQAGSMQSEEVRKAEVEGFPPVRQPRIEAPSGRTAL